MKKELTLEEFKSIMRYLLNDELKDVKEDIKKLSEKDLNNPYLAFDFGMKKGRELEVELMLEKLGNEQ